MTVETATYVNQFSATLPPRSDLEVEGADHLRLIKSVLQNTFPNAGKIFNFIITNKTAGNYTVQFPSDMNSIQVIDASGGNRTVTMPAPSGVSQDGWKLWVVKFDSTLNTVTVDGAGNPINGASTYVLNFPNQILELVWSQAASAWYAADSLQGAPPGYSSQSSNYTLLATDSRRFIDVDATLASRTITLPTTFNSGYAVTITKIDSTVNPVVLSPASGLINGLASISLYGQFDSIRAIWTGATWRALIERQDNLPVGMKGDTFMTSVPGPKWLLLNGTNFNRTTYAPLFALWGTNFGVGDGSTTAGMPDVRGYFPRFWNNGAGNDPDAGTRTSRGDGTGGDTPGTKQQDDFKAHNHTYATVTNGTAGSTGGAPQNIYQTTGTVTGTSPASGGNETRSKNIYVAGYVKALP